MSAFLVFCPAFRWVKRRPPCCHQHGSLTLCTWIPCPFFAMSGAGFVSLCKVVSGLGIGCIIFTTVIKLSLTRSWTRAEADDSLSLGPFCSLLVLQETSTACVPKGQREKEIHTSLLFQIHYSFFFLVFCFPGPFLQFPYLQLDPSLTHPLCFVTQRPQLHFYFTSDKSTQLIIRTGWST